MAEEVEYTEDNIRSLDWKEHIRMRPGMYIGKLGDGTAYDDGIYVLVKEVLDNCIDEFVMGNGRTIEVSIKDKTVKIRDYGRGVPLGKVVDVVSKINTGGKYDSKAFKKSVGLNGVGTKAVNALSDHFKVSSYREGEAKVAGVINEAEKQNLTSAAQEIQQLLEQLSATNPTTTTKEKMTVVGEVADRIENNPPLKSKVISALKSGGTEAFKEAVNHPLVNILVATIEGWQDADF